MIVLEFKLKGKSQQYRVIDEMIRTAQFVRNKALRYWIDNQGVKLVDLYKQCAIMAKEFEWARKLNSMARQASAERAIFAIQRFFSNCKTKKPGKKGYPQFKKHTRSVEYKTSGWALSTEKRCLTFTDGFAAGTFGLLGSRDLHFYAPKEIKRVRVIRRADGYYAQFCINVERTEEIVPTGKTIVRNMVKNHKLAKSISDAAWSQFAEWLQYFGKVYGKTVVAVAPQYTSQDCSTCGNRVQKSLSVRTHVCRCGTVLDRDHNAALNILAKGLKEAGINLNTVGHTEINAWGQTNLYSLVVTKQRQV
jgi:IS605 OrfB family transposase